MLRVSRLSVNHLIETLETRNLSFWRPLLVYLVLVQFTVLVLLLALFLESDDDKSNKDVHHEEGDEDDVDDEEDRDVHTVIEDRSKVLLVCVNGSVQQPGKGGV